MRDSNISFKTSLILQITLHLCNVTNIILYVFSNRNKVFKICELADIISLFFIEIVFADNHKLNHQFSIKSEPIVYFHFSP
jgi:hypothetical protein